MILNNTHIQGIFVYSPSAEYERGDFVVSGDSIYICTATDPTDKTLMTVSGIDPKNDTINFNTYLGSKIQSAQEYFDYISNPIEKEDKYISSQTLSEILSTYMSGFSEKGIITDHISLTDSGALDLGIGIYGASLPENLINATTENVLDQIITDPNLNNAIFYVSRELPEIKADLPSIPDSLLGYTELDKKSVILKQYSYIDSSSSSGISVKYRIQELIDHVNAMILYRFGSSENGNFTNVTNWRSSFYDASFKNKLDYVRTYYTTRSAEIERKLRSVIGKNFSYRNVEIEKSPKITIQCTDPGRLGYIPVPGFNNSQCVLGIVTQELYSNLGGGVFKNSSLTIDLRDSFGSDSVLKYYINSRNTLSITNPGADSIELSVATGNIVNIYYRQYYLGDER